jgi:hypothetical protein
MKNQEDQNNHLAIFKGKRIRRVIHNKEWWFSIIDVIEVLTGSERPRKYWSDLKKKLINEGYHELSEKIGQLKIIAPDGKMRETDCADTETIFRIIQSVPSPKVEPLKRWLAKVGFERVQEIENPELATKRTKTLYKLKGYPEEWIEKRMRGIAIREELTDEWKNRGAKADNDYEILTAEISKATFGITPNAYKKLKGLKRENLRDHMGNIELILTMLGESTVTEIHRTKNTQGVPMLKEDARAGGQIAGSARKQIEHKLGRSIVSKKNFLKPSTRKEITK